MAAWSIAELEEEKLVALMFEDVRTYQHVALPPQTPWPVEVRLRVTPEDVRLDRSAFGDVDALIVPQGSANLARAVQFKRVKVSPSTFTHGVPNKLPELTKAVHQANALVTAGFSTVWIVVLVVTDSRGVNGDRPVFQGPTAAMLQLVSRAIPLSKLDPLVGLHIAELSQPFDRPINETGLMGGNIVRLANAQDQPDGLSEAIRQLFRRTAA